MKLGIQLILLRHTIFLLSIIFFSGDILVFTVATDETDGFQRYLHTALEYGIRPHVLGLGQKWLGGDDMKTSTGGGWKVNLLKEALEPYKEDREKIVLFTDGYDVIFLSDLKAILDAFKKSEARVLFSAEGFCWPDSSLAEKYPEVKNGKRYLNSGMYMGYMPEILELLNRKPIENTDDDQLFFTEAFIDKDLRNKLRMKLDYTSIIFQNLNGASSTLTFIFIINIFILILIC